MAPLEAASRFRFLWEHKQVMVCTNRMWWYSLFTPLAFLTAGDAFNASIDVGNVTIDALSTTVGVELEAVGHSIVGGGLSSQLLFDASFEDPKDKTPPSPSPGRAKVQLRVADTPSLSLRHCSAQLFATPMGIGPDLDHAFNVVALPGALEHYVSFQSVNFPSYYLGELPPTAGLACFCLIYPIVQSSVRPSVRSPVRPSSQ